MRLLMMNLVTIFSVFDTVEEAIALANSTDYSLSAALFTTDLHAAMDISPRIRSGEISPSPEIFGVEQKFQVM